MSPRITRISKTLSPATPYKRKLHTPHDSPPTRHEVHIDLNESGHPSNGRTTPDPNFLSNIRAAVAQGDVDAVVMYHGSPVEEEWQALEGAQPWHLELLEGFLELCWYEGLKELATPWHLRSVYIATYNGVSGGWQEEDEEEDEDEGQCTAEEHGSSQSNVQETEQPAKTVKTQPSFPACYSSIETLVLDYPNYRELYFYPEGGAQNLRSLTICENEALKTLACTIVCNPALVNTLQTVTILRPSDYEGYDFEGRVVKRFFRDSKALRNVELVLGAGAIRDHGDDDDSQDLYARYQAECPYTGLHSCLPSTLEYLSLSCPADRLTFVDLDHWIACTQDPAWLPNLHTAAFSLALPSERLLSLSWEDEKVLDGKVEQLLEVLRERNVDVVEPRPRDEMHYPLPR